MNTLYFGDNLDVLRREISDSSVDLVYLDPPFQSGKDYEVVLGPRTAGGSRGRAEAFRDTWRWGQEAQASYAEVERAGGSAAATMRALRAILGETDTTAYLSMMAPRLLELRRALRPTGSLYLHCDPGVSHHLRVLLDGIFGAACFRNEVVWRYRRWPAKARRFQRMHDVLLFYAARPDAEPTFHTLYGYEKLAPSTLKTFGTRKQRADFSSGHRKPGLERAASPGPPLSDYWDIDQDRDGFEGGGGLAEGGSLPLSDTWEIGVIAPIGLERTGYPTQKPEALLERVVRASSNANDRVLDPFCGSGTALAVAERLGRRWVGIDASAHAIDLARKRLDGAQFEVRDAREGGARPSSAGDPCGGTPDGQAAAKARQDSGKAERAPSPAEGRST